jgi:hypothetical protein
VVLSLNSDRGGDLATFGSGGALATFTPRTAGPPTSVRNITAQRLVSAMTQGGGAVRGMNFQGDQVDYIIEL